MVCGSVPGSTVVLVVLGASVVTIVAGVTVVGAAVDVVVGAGTAPRATVAEQPASTSAIATHFTAEEGTGARPPATVVAWAP
jgi:hypothetical protein